MSGAGACERCPAAILYAQLLIKGALQRYLTFRFEFNLRRYMSEFGSEFCRVDHEQALVSL